MKLRLPLLIALVVGLSVTGNLPAQRTGELTSQSARRVGLIPVWSKAIAMGYGGKISGVTVYVSPTKSYQGSEVVDKFGRRTFFSDRDAVAPSLAGYDQTLRMSDLKKAELESRGLKPRSELKQIPDVTIYVRSNLGTVTSIDAESGQHKWTTQAGKSGYPSYGVTATDQYVVTISGSTLYLLDAETGQVLDTVPTRLIPGSTPSIDGDLIYLPTSKGLVEVLSAEDLSRTEFTIGSSGRIDDPVTISPKTASWTTSSGHIYVANAAAPGLIYHFQSMDTIAAAPVYMDSMLFATSLDGFAYAIDEASGDVNWRYSAGGPIREAPLAVAGCIYVTTTDGQMSALDSATGDVKWLASGVERFVSVTDSTVYCITSGQMLTAYDKATGARTGSAQVGQLGLPVVNTHTDRVYLISKSGVLHCLREPRNRWPIARVPVLREETTEVTETESGESPANTDPAPSAELDESAVNDAGDDPFGDSEVGEADPAEPATDGTDDEIGDDGEDPFGDDFGGDDAGDDPFGDF